MLHAHKPSCQPTPTHLSVWSHLLYINSGHALYEFSFQHQSVYPVVVIRCLCCSTKVVLYAADMDFSSRQEYTKKKGVRGTYLAGITLWVCIKTLNYKNDYVECLCAVCGAEDHFNNKQCVKAPVYISLTVLVFFSPWNIC